MHHNAVRRRVWDSGAGRSNLTFALSATATVLLHSRKFQASTYIYIYGVIVAITATGTHWAHWACLLRGPFSQLVLHH